MSVFIIFTSIIITALSMWLLAPASIFGYLIGLTLGIILLLSTIRMIGKKSRKSLVAAELFYKITKHKATIYNISRQPYNVSVTVYGNGDNDYENILDILTHQMQYPTDEAKKAAKYAMDTVHDKPLQEKVRVALQSLDTMANQGDFVART